MRPQELRIGNYVFDCEGYRDTVTSISEDAVFLNNITLKHSLSSIAPVPLTEEWLERFGFVRGAQFGEWLSPPIKSDKTKLRILTDWIGFYWGFSLFGSVRLPYIHSLQNLIYSLTGEELKIKGDGK